MSEFKNYDKFYQQLTGRIRESGAACSALRAVSKAVTGVFYAAYPLLLVLLAAAGRRGQLARTILVPGISFCLLTLVRARINRPRPYETWRIDPLIHKDTRGNSMPSRHVFSSVVIAMVWIPVSRAVGILLLMAGAAAALVRVLGGVHYPSDVAAGYLAGVLSGLLIFL